VSPNDDRPSCGAPSASAPRPGERRFDVQTIDSADGRREIVLQELSWGEGIGWYVQKTLHLDSQEVDALMGALCCARQELTVSRRSRSTAVCPRERLVAPPEILQAATASPTERTTPKIIPFARQG